ncbi:MAG TPA: cupin domain-containing protein, partial [Rhodospirillales bacterium]|nr:cupin domain-containing protein [Rhodospirillales bacterium]
MDAETVINLLGLEPHPEGEHYREVFRDPAVTAIYYLLKEGEVSAWRRAGAVEIWRHYDGAPLDLAISDDGEKSETQILGKNLAAGQRPQAYVPAGAWQ